MTLLVLGCVGLAVLALVAAVCTDNRTHSPSREYPPFHETSPEASKQWYDSLTPRARKAFDRDLAVKLDAVRQGVKARWPERYTDD